MQRNKAPDDTEITTNVDSSYESLLATAHQAKEMAYCKHSGYKVGAALLAKDGVIITACNVENASYGLTICAERAAIAKAVSMGYRPGDFEAIAIAASGPNFSPCGACREVINEFGENIVVVFEFDGRVISLALADILPFNFKM
ncbi:MAG: cytidine deaminase [Geobacter sp.]|nr:cytidine deaminase [Geobacter sp.]